MARKPTAAANAGKRPSGLLDRLQAPTSLKHELMAVGYATAGVSLVVWALALMRS